MRKDHLKQWAENWIKGLKTIEAQHKENKDKNWINKNEAIKMLLEAYNIITEVAKK
jgi:inorganic pyrophosphatase